MAARRSDPLIEQTIPALVNGVSRQSIQSRRDSQCDEQDNIVSTVANGIIRRPPTEHVASLGYVVGDGTIAAPTDFTYDDTDVDVTDNSINSANTFAYTGEFGPISLGPYNAVPASPGDFLEDGSPYWINIISSTKFQFLTGQGGSVVDITGTGQAGITGTVFVSGNGNAAGSYTVAPVASNGAHFSIINRGDAQQFLVVLANGTIDVYDVATGAAVVVNDLAPGAQGTYGGLVITGGGAAGDTFETVTIADYTFIVNKSNTLAMSGTLDGPRSNEHEFLIGVKEGATSGYYNRLRLTLGTATVISSTTNGTSSDLMMDNFCQILTGITNPDDRVGVASGNGEFQDWKFTRLNRTVIHGYQFQNLGAKFEVETEDLYGDTIHELMTTTTDGLSPSILKFSDVPAEAVANFTIEVAGDEGNVEDSFFIRYDANRRTWIETVKPNIDNTFDASTFPHALIYNQTTGQFDYQESTWEPRLVGDSVSAPQPEGIGETVNDLFIHENRLCILTGENVLMSEAGDYFNFWPTTVTTIIDSDPIDVAGTGNRVAVWDYAVPARRQILLFSSVGNLVSSLAGGGSDNSMSLKNARIQVVGSHSLSKKRPRTLGQSVYYSTDKSGSSAISEMKEIEVEIWNSDDISAHVPGYIPANITDSSASDSEQMIVYRSAVEPDTLYIYSAETVGGTPVISSWSKWDFGSDAVIYSAEWVESVLYLVLSRAGGSAVLEKIDFGKLDEESGVGATPLGYRVHLDTLTSMTGVYDIATNLTSWTTPFNASGGTYRLIRGGLWGTGRGLDIPLESFAVATATAQGDWSAFPVWFGREYLSRYQMSQIVKRNADGFGELNGRLQIRKGRVSYSDTGAFDVVISSTADDGVSTVPYTPNIVGGMNVGAPVLADGTFVFHIGGKSEDVRVTFQSTSFLPFSLSSVNWEGRFYKVPQF